VAVEVIVGDGLEVEEAGCGGFVGEVGHAAAHFFGNVDDHGFVPRMVSNVCEGRDSGNCLLGGKEVDFCNNDIVFDEKLSVLLLRAAAVEVPAWVDSVYVK